MDDSRTGDIAENLRLLRERLDVACRAAGRPPGDVTLVAVTKTYPAADVVRLARLGVPDVGENRDQEAAPKAAEAAAAGVDVRWHFVGRLQRNKARSVARYAHLVHSVDSVRLAGALAEAVRQEERATPLDALVQVSLDDDPTRGGAVTGAVDPVAEAVAGAGSLRLRGVMAVAPLGWEPDAAFSALAQVAARVRASFPEADQISAGMSGDFESAILHGSTQVRVGSALLGKRLRLG